MPYDTLITKRKSCNYCIRIKQVPTESGLRWYINDSKCLERIEINYCPICGKDLKVDK